MPNGTSVDQLYIDINASASKANSAIDKLCGKLDKLSASLRRTNGAQLTGLSVGVQRLGNAMNTMNQIKTADFTRLATNLAKMGNVDVGKLNSAAVSISHIGTSLNQLGNISDNAQKFSELAKGIAQLGYKSATKAIENIPKLAIAMRDLITTLSKAPMVNQNLIDMTNALAKLARTGSSSGKAVKSLSNSFDVFSKKSSKSKKSSFSLASAIGKVYATYWLLFRAFEKIKQSIDIASKLTEVQNVVDVTFGKYSDVVEKMSKTSIADFGMSELTVKEVSSRFQAMGTAMGFAQGEMAKTSVELTKLTADMASFYNMEQKDVAEDLEAIFTGQTRPLRTYGLDLTEATLKEWALKNGMDANIKSMSQMEKATLRYQYVMANTGAAQGDFARTANTWANQVRILRQNFEKLSTIFGTSLINAFKPVITALNVVIGKFIAFAEVVSASLGKIFGWTYKSESSGGGVANELETGEDAAEGISDGMGNAADNAKKLRQQLQGFDELNVLSSNDSSESGSGGGSGGVANAVGAGGANASVGQWERDESIFESELDSLYKLGDYISTKLTDSLNSINWDSIYESARNFGTGLADFLNGLISPELFSSLGSTIAKSINTVFEASNSFAKNIEWKELGESLISTLTAFFTDWDAKLTGQTFSNFIKGFIETFTGAFQAISDQETFKRIGQKIVDLICGIDWGGILWDLGELSVTLFKAIIDGLSDAADGMADAVKNKMKPVWKSVDQWWKDNVKLKKIDAPSIGDIKAKVQSAWTNARNWWSKNKPSLSTITVKVTSFKDKIKESWAKARDWWNKNKPSLSAITAKIKIPRLTITWDTTGAAAKMLQKLGLKGFPNFSVRYYAMGGFPEDGWFRANHGELMGKFDNGRTVVANNKQITQGIADAVYQGNRENNALMRRELELMQRQNELLMDILEKETGISEDEVFRSVRKSADNYKRMTGRPAFSW